MAQQKFYVVWAGHNPGVYDNWEDALEQIKNFPGARYRSFPTAGEAAEAYRDEAAASDELAIKNLLQKSRDQLPRTVTNLPAEVDPNGWAVDASCMGNPGVMEYRGVELATGREIFKIGPFQDATNNIGEFLAIVHAMALMYNNKEQHPIYSDSMTAMSWVRKRKCGSTLKRTGRNDKVFELLDRALLWISTHQFPAPVYKWNTQAWGEIPADFGRK